MIFYLRPVLAAAAALASATFTLTAAPVFAQTGADLLKMIEIERPAEVRAQLRRGVSPDSADVRGDGALVVASRSGQLDVVQILVEGGARVNLRNRWGDTALMVGALNGRDKIVRYLRSKGGDVNSSGWTALHYAAVNGHADIAKYLMDQGANPLASSPNGVTPLMMAARENKTDVVKVLLEYGADIAQKNDKGETAYDWAVREEHKAAIELLKNAR